MSKAFTNEDAQPADDTAPLPPRLRVPLPITAGGRVALVDELARLQHSGASTTRRARQLVQILETTVVTAPPAEPAAVGFGSRVDVRHADGSLQSFTIVGPDEAAPAAGKVSIDAPLVRALLGERAGAAVTVARPRGDEDVEIVAVDNTGP